MLETYNPEILKTLKIFLKIHFNLFDHRFYFLNICLIKEYTCINVSTIHIFCFKLFANNVRLLTQCCSIYLEITFALNCTTEKPKGKQLKGAFSNANCVRKKNLGYYCFDKICK